MHEARNLPVFSPQRGRLCRLVGEDGQPESPFFSFHVAQSGYFYWRNDSAILAGFAGRSWESDGTKRTAAAEAAGRRHPWTVSRHSALAWQHLLTGQLVWCGGDTESP